MRLVALAVVVLVLAGCGGSGSQGSRSTTVPRSETSGQSTIRVRLGAQSHHPRVGGRWRYEVRVTDASGRPVPAKVHLQILFGGVPVGQVGTHRVANGIWRETIGAPGNPPFPARARGQPLVFQAVVTARGQTKKANWWIRVR